jgi:transposase
MTVTRTRKRSRARFVEVLQKPKGVIHPRVQKVGPEHFGIVSIDCAKARCKWMLCDFYGNVLIPPTIVALNRNDIQAALERLREALERHDIKDQLVAVERTGRYHHFIRDAFRAAGYEVRLVHPFTTNRFRQPSDPGVKTDDIDMAAIHCATANGFALIEPQLDEAWTTLQLRVRQRRDLVRKSSQLCCQIRERLEACLPGFAACFEQRFWESPVAWTFIRQFPTAQAMHQAGLDGLQRCLSQANIRHQQRTLTKVLAWAGAAAAPELAGSIHHAIALALNEDRLRKTLEIQALESELASRLAGTPYIRLLSVPGINVISAADLGGEMGPIDHYLNGRSITGRAGLRPSRRQSDAVDRPNGPLIRCANRRLRAALMWIADNLVVCNQHFNVLAAHWKAAGKDPRLTRSRVASRFARIAYQIVAGNQVCRHPAMQQQSYILEKLLIFHTEHGTPVAQILADLQTAAGQLPKSAYAREAQPLADILRKLEHGRKRGPVPIADIIPIVLARLGVRLLQSKASGEADSR